MKFRRFLYILLAVIISVTSISVVDAYGAKKRSRSKSRTSQTYSKKRSSSKKKSSSSSRNRKSTTKKVATTPPEEKPSNDSLTLAVNAALLDWIPGDANPGGLRVNRVSPNSKQSSVSVSLNENYTYMPVTRELINGMTKVVQQTLPDSISDFNISFSVGNRNLSYYINKIDKLPEQYRRNVPFVTAVNPFVHPKKGMEGDIIALWHSHGRYYKNGAWQWQRVNLFQSIEDTYTMGYVIPFLVPMLENAGAYVMLPRERDYNRNEVIVDNDTNDGGMLFSQTTYMEQNGAKKWTTGELEGFIYDLPDFRDTENPFENGTYRQVETVSSGNKSVAAWYADIPEDGEYAVYVSYKSLPNSTTDAHYTVNYSGGSREFTVNQTMGGGTWIYLGTFPLEEGYSATIPVVTLTNHTDKEAGTIVTADAVKIGGGMGNIARSPRRADIYYDPSTPDKSLPKDALASNSSSKQNDESYSENAGDEDDDEGDDEGDDEDDESDDESEAETAPAQPAPDPSKAPRFITSGMPRYLEGARYWLHWAGMPESVYSPYHGADDYKDDYTCRGQWVNYLAGGSRVLPNREGLKIPVDISFALHSDAGKRADDSTVGTLGIYYTNNGDSYVDGTPRSNSRMLTDLLMRQITSDIRRTYEPRWTRRSMWDKSYLEARVAEVPTTLIEILSHQNFGDMQYGLDPNFRFVVSRAIYKAMARFISERKDREVVIQPLPVHNFAIKPLKKGHYRLSWVATPDSLEPTAKPSKYIIMERTEGTLGFHKAGETSSTHFEIKVADDLVHSYKIIAANEGGISFPSEVLALRACGKDMPEVLIINGFDRVSAPGMFTDDGTAGFRAEEDFGVPYINDASFTGYQTEFRRNAGESFGKSATNYIGTVVAGNTFDFPKEHGESFADAGMGFVSCSAGAVEAGGVDLEDYKFVDLILGKQKRTVTGRGTSGVRYTAFPAALQKSLEAFVKQGGHLIVSGEYVSSDLYDYRSDYQSREFASEVLGLKKTEEKYSRQRGGKINTHGVLGNSTVAYSNTVNKDKYIVENPDVLEPARDDVQVIATFSDTGLPAGVFSKYGKGSAAVFSVPLESIKDENDMTKIIEKLLKK